MEEVNRDKKENFLKNIKDNEIDWKKERGWKRERKKEIGW